MAAASRLPAPPRPAALILGLAVGLALAPAAAHALAGAPALAAPPAADADRPEAVDGQGNRDGDGLEDLLARMTSFFHRRELDGVTPDPRAAINPSEAARLGVVSQLLAFNQMARLHPSRVARQDVIDRADFLLAHFGELTSGTAFDGMTGYALLGAYDITRDPRYLDQSRVVVDRSLALSGWQNTLNWGLMSALTLAKYYDLTGDLAARDKTLQILASLRPYQNPDGSFPHYCPGSVDVHYTAWMSMELLIVRRWVTSPLIDQYLAGTRRFLAQCVDSTGLTTYQVPCAECPGGWFYRFGRRSGCVIDYDTRGWVNELGYSALLYGEMHDPLAARVLGALRALESGGAFADKWDYLPDPFDPIYPWATESPSVIRTSVIFWSLAELEADRRGAWIARRGGDGDARGGRGDGDGGHSGSGDPADRDPDLAQRGSGAAALMPDGAAAGPVSPHGASDESFGADSLMLAVVQGHELGAPQLGGSAQGGGDGGDPLRHGGGRTAAVRAGAPDSDTHAPIATTTQEPAGAPAWVTRIAGVSPNPARQSCTIAFTLAREGAVRLDIFDLAGRRLRTLEHGVLAAGVHRSRWDGLGADGRPAAAGLYFAALSSGEGRFISRFAVTR